MWIRSKRMSFLRIFTRNVFFGMENQSNVPCKPMTMKAYNTSTTPIVPALSRNKMHPAPMWTFPLQIQRHLSIKRKDYIFPELKDEDLEEDFVRGSGPGGQSVNKTSNCVVLKHKPTGIVVKCHETRSLQENRKKARERLQDRIDQHLFGDKSFLGQQRSEGKEDRAGKKRKAKDRLERKKAFKEKEGLD